MVLMLDTMAQRYGCLPSEILARGDTLDIAVMCRATAWNNERMDREQRGQSMPSNYGYNSNELQAMLDKAKQL